MMRSSSPSSSLSSLGSRSPSLPGDYPSPPSSSMSDASSQLSDPPESLPDRDASPPPAKKRKIWTAPVLETEELDMIALNDSSSDAYHKSEGPKLEKLMKVLHSKKRIVVIAGAGISVSAGIPDFRSSTGLFTTLKSQNKLKASGKHLFDASVYRDDPSTESFHNMVRELSHKTKNAQATPFHHMLARLAEEKRLMRLYTQNVDGIDTSMEPLATAVPLNKKGPWPRTIQLHGGLNKMVCSKCGHLADFDGALFEGPEPPSCSECVELDGVRVASGLRSHGIGCLRPRMVLYNEFNPDEEAIGAVSAADLKRGPDAVLVVGTTLKVPGIRRLAKEMCAVTRGRKGGFTAWINIDPVPKGPEFKDSWDMVVRAESDDIAQKLGLPRWDDTDTGEYSLLTKEELKAKKGKPSVVLESKVLQTVEKDGFITPGASPRRQSPAPVSANANEKPKPKQLQLSFGPKSAATKDSKVKKPRKKRAAAPKDKATTANAFANAQITKASVGKNAEAVKLATMDHASTNVRFFPGPGLPDSAMLKPISSADRRINYELPPSYNFQVQVPNKNTRTPLPTSFKAEPESPTTPRRASYDRNATISPPSFPSGMRHLINT